MKNIPTRFGVVSGLLSGFSLCLSGSALAANGVSIGNSLLLPSLRAEWFEAGNVYSGDGSELDSSGVLLRPEVALKTSTGDTAVEIGYRGAFARYDDASDADYDDQTVYADGDIIFSSRSRASARLYQSQTHVLYGTTLSRTLGDGDEPITYKEAGLNLSHTYGASDARGNLRTELDWGTREYDNYAALTEGLDFSSITPAFSLLYAVSSDTRALVGLSYQLLDYDSGAKSDSDTISVFTGAEWEATGKTGGTARVGVSNRSFDQSGRDNETTVTIATTGYWTPLSYSRFELELNRNFAVDTLSNTVVTTAALNWRHDWTTRFRSFALLRRADYASDSDVDDRTLDTARLRFGLGATQWLTFTAEVAKEWSASPTPSLDFERDWMAVGVELAL